MNFVTDKIYQTDFIFNKAQETPRIKTYATDEATQLKMKAGR